jgi:hypothetical protein
VKLFLKKFEWWLSLFLLVFGLAIPFLIFLNRVFIPDVSADSLNYHLYLGFKGINWENNKYEFFPTGIHNFSPILDMVGFGFNALLGYRLGTFFSVLAIYLGILAIYKIYKLLNHKGKILGDLGSTFLLVSSFLSFELFLGVGSYYVDGLVAMAGLWVVYWLIKGNLFLAGFLLSVLVAGKQTNLYLVPAFGMVVLYQWFKKKIATKKALLVLGVVMLLPLWWYGKNWLVTGSPIFPFYNAVFKSKYFAPVSFHEPQFGGENLWQRLGWGYYSALKPARLGQVHDLFNDYKINIYFVMAILALFLARSWLVSFYVVAFLGWGLSFGYLRYGLILEYLGGLIILLIYSKFQNKSWRYFLFLPLFLVLLVQNKRVVNLSLAYDIGFRPGYFYNRESYPKEFKNILASKIKADKSLVYKPDIYLNCEVGGMTYYVLSPFTNLPVLNIGQNAYSQMTNNSNYKEESKLRLEKHLRAKDRVKFVTIAARSGMNTEYESCLKNITIRGFMVESEEETSFLGYERQKLVIITGHL